MKRPFEPPMETERPRRWANWFGLRCLMRSCGCRHYEDEGGCGGQCVMCGKVVGYVTRAQLRAWSERELASDER